MAAIDFDTLSKKVFERLSTLPPVLTYHAVDHTKDVIEQSERIGIAEGIKGRELYLLKLAALYHDTGFLYKYKGHEEKSCEIFTSDASQLELSKEDISLVQSIIMATRVPQLPKTLLQKIICDADLDYLGRTDFIEIAGRLKEEFLNYGIVKDEAEWKRLQSKFFHEHHYHTTSSQQLREPGKQMNFHLLS